MSEKFNELGKNLDKTKLGYYIDNVSRLEIAHLNFEFEKIGITFSQFRVLNWVWRYKELTQKELHELVKIKPSSLTTILNILIKKDLVKRNSDDNDARIRIITLTNKSLLLEIEAWNIINNFDCKIKEILTDDEYEITLNSLRKLMSAL
ncbi:MarR family winged helix-turn-helix transcriptional regulator [Clostridiaceae bacterium HSG29]|nr:MarR family winged helix-turn-helix transcriptional regulator [Clostridiaceae bacterium HSG29]